MEWFALRAYKFPNTIIAALDISKMMFLNNIWLLHVADQILMLIFFECRGVFIFLWEKQKKNYCVPLFF